MKWTKADEEKVLKMRQTNKSYVEIAQETNRTISSVKHKIRRLQQNQNNDRYKHTTEKIEQAEKYICGDDLRILETHAGFGNMSNFYKNYGSVLALDKKQNRLDHIEGCKTICCDSEQEIYRLIYEKQKFDIIDIDPYGFSSRYFPHVLKLIDSGLLFLTFPMMGVSQINKITIEHYSVFWNIRLADVNNYVEKIICKLNDFGFMSKRKIEVLDVVKIGRIYRFCISVKKESLLKLVGLTVNR